MTRFFIIDKTMKLYNPQTILPFLNVSDYLQGNTGIFGTATALSNAQVFINSAVGTNVGLVVRGAVSQSASLQQWQNSAGTLLMAIAGGGNFVVGGLTTIGSTAAVAGSQLGLITGASRVGISIRGHSAQSLNLQEWRNSSDTALASVSANGTISGTLFRQSPTWVPPANSNSQGVAGEIGCTQEHVYYCWSTNNWVRAAFSAF